MIITEYKEDEKPISTNFPKRNRIISGLSKKVIVVEAPLGSGALITADYAIEQNKELFCLIGDITKENFLGTNFLVKEGAKPLTEISTFLL